jgi:hypothetical protein
VNVKVNKGNIRHEMVFDDGFALFHEKREWLVQFGDIRLVQAAELPLNHAFDEMID